jgi:hypothetical protein
MWGVSLSASPAARQALGNGGVAIFYGEPIAKHRSTVNGGVKGSQLTVA